MVRLATLLPNAFATSAFVSRLHGFGKPADAVGTNISATATGRSRRMRRA
jgi:hypothetical protein